MVRTRFAPSPTGSMHIGGIRTALYCYAMAKKNNGSFILRIEDTDRTRYVEGSVEEILEMLKAYGLEPDESIEHGGNYGPYIQSERLDLYKKYAEELVEKGDAYYCFATKGEIDEERKQAQEDKKPFVFRSKYRNLDIEEAKKKIENGESYVIRHKVPSEKIVNFNDAVQGKMKFNTNDVDDTVLLKSDGFPTYHLAVVIDDHLMKISHMFRAAEWIPSSPKLVLLYEAFGWEMPVVAHPSTILDPSGGKLSKRKGSVAAKEFLVEGYLPEALLNFLMLLGWSSPEKREHGTKEREFYSLSEFVELFDIENLNKSNPVFNREKLLWFNQKYISNLTPDQLVLKFTAWLDKYTDDDQLKKAITEKGPDYLEDVVELIRERVSLLSDIPAMLMPFYFVHESIDFGSNKQTEKLEQITIKNLIKDFVSEYNNAGAIKEWGHDKWEHTVRELAEKYSTKAGQAFMALRLVTLGTPFSPPLYESMEVLGDDELKRRFDAFLE